MGWKRDPSHMIRLDPPQGDPFPFPHSPPGSPSQQLPGPSLPDSNCHRSTSTEADPDGPTSPSALSERPTGPLPKHSTSHSTSTLSTALALRFLTINAKKAGANSPSLVDVITMLEQNSSDFLLLTETPLSPHRGALLQSLRNRGYGVHHHPSNAPFQPDGLPEARLSDHIIHPGGGCWLAYKKHTSWTTLVCPLTLPINCPRATTYVVELTLVYGTKAAIISCYLPQPVEAHSNTCAILAQLPHTLSHPLIILGGDLHGELIKGPRRSYKSLPIHTKGGQGQHCPPSLHTNNRALNHV